MRTEGNFQEQAYNMEFSVRYGEIGSDGVATLSAVGNWLQEAAGLSADILGFGARDLLPLGKTWVLARLVLRIARLPLAGERLIVHTWPSTLAHFGTRGYEIFDSSGKVILSSGSAWLVMDIHDRTLASLPESLVNRYPSNPRTCDRFVCRVIPRLREGACECLIRVRRDDLDINGHVNNTRYMAWILEPLYQHASEHPQERTPLAPRLMDITFRSECFPQEELQSLFAPLKSPMGIPNEVMGEKVPYALLHSIRRNANGNEVCRALTLWDMPPYQSEDLNIFS